MNLKGHSAFTEPIWIKVGFLVGAFLFAYGRVMPLLVRTWSRDDYSHGFLVPIIAFYFIWNDRKRLRNVPIQPNIPGGIILTLIGGVMLLIGDIGGVVIIQELSLIIVIPGLVLMLLGTRHLAVLSLPLAYLILMVPILDEFIENIHWPFQLLSAKMGCTLFKIFGFPVFQNANYIQLPNITLEVAEACSGIRYLISIIAIAIPLAYLTQRSWRRKIILTISAVIIGIMTNGLRVTLIGIWAYYYTGYPIHGPFHIFQGICVSVVGFVFLFISAWFLSKIPFSKV